jgi:hypothetical protein
VTGILTGIRSRAELPLLAVPLLLGYLLTTYHPTREVFLGEFNTVDGSIYAARFADALLAFVMLWMVGLRWLPAYLQRRRMALFVLQSIALIVVLAGTAYFLDRIILTAYNLPIRPGEVSDKMITYPRRLAYDASVLPGIGLAYALALAYGLARGWFVQSQAAKLLVQEKMQADIDLLRSQINPHFFFNSMNNILAITQRNQDDEAGRAITKLAGMMRYMIYDSNTETIDLGREMEHIENYLEIARLKFAKDDPVELSLSKAGQLKGVRIAPLLLIPFVENAVKHGVNSQGEGSVSIQVEATDRRVQFQVVNSKHPAEEEFRKHSGIGLKNVKQRLQLLYPGRHELNLVETDATYSADLILKVGG